MVEQYVLRSSSLAGLFGFCLAAGCGLFLLSAGAHCRSFDVGSTWEHILLLLRCPFLALSATIGEGFDTGLHLLLVPWYP
jgi:hypothetical protein